MTKTLIMTTSILLMSACSDQPQRGFSLPEGDAQAGQLLFEQYECIECHTIAGSDPSGNESKLTENDSISIELGGAKKQAQSYADLITSVINPNHRIAKGYDLEDITDEDGDSKMTYYNSVMAVDELIDIVSYLESKYTVIDKPYTHYQPYVFIPPH